MNILKRIILFVAVVGFNLSVYAQGTAFTYQGRLSNGTNAATGSYDLRFTLFDAATSGTQQGSFLTNTATPVSNGLFTATLDFGNQFPGANRWLEIGVRTNGNGAFTTLAPRQQLTPTPYAITASNLTGTLPAAQLSGALPATQLSGTLASSQLSGTYSGAVTFNNAANSFTGSGGGLTNLNASSLTSGTVPDARLGTNVARLIVPNSNGQATATPIVSGGFVTGANIISGGSGYAVAPTVTVNDATGSNAVLVAQISGAGVVTNISVSNPGAHYSGAATLAFGAPPSNAYQIWKTTGNAGTTAGREFLGTTDNQPLELWVNGMRALRLEPNNTNIAPNLIGGSFVNFVANGVVGATIAGGGGKIGTGTVHPDTNSVLADYGTVGGGRNNTASAQIATVAGGSGNTASGYASSLGGGGGNTASGGSSEVGGGEMNTASGNYSAVGGGNQNTPSGDYSTIGGGSLNTAGGGSATVAGGDHANASGYGSTVGGGTGNQATNWYTTASGGEGNSAFGDHASVSGGKVNTASGDYSTVSGGLQNAAGGADSTVGGGYQNQATNQYSIVGGGLQNTAGGPSTTVSGGYGNSAIGYQATVGGGLLNHASADKATVSGGSGNQATNTYSTISGGEANFAFGDHATVGGGYQNQALSVDAVVSGGYQNLAKGVQSFVGGGFQNNAEGVFATVPGGSLNWAKGISSFAAGNRAKAQADGAFVWADTQAADFSPATADEVSFRCRGGFTISIDSAYSQTVHWTPGNMSWTFTSDRNAKDRFAPLDTRSVLEKVSQLPLTEWSYKGYPQRHIGPMAQDFHAAFPFNNNDKAIDSGDMEAVALAAIQGLNKKVEEKDAEIQNLKARLEKLEQLISANKGGVK